MLQYNNYLHGIYIVLSIKSCLEIIYNTQENMRRLHANVVAFIYIRDSSILRFCYHWGSWHQSPADTRDDYINGRYNTDPNMCQNDYACG
jgi:hypothetical protein